MSTPILFNELCINFVRAFTNSTFFMEIESWKSTKPSENWLELSNEVDAVHNLCIMSNKQVNSTSDFEVTATKSKSPSGKKDEIG